MFSCLYFQCSSLLEEDGHDDFFDDLKDEYEDIRREHYNNYTDRKYLTLDQVNCLPIKSDEVFV